MSVVSYDDEEKALLNSNHHQLKADSYKTPTKLDSCDEMEFYSENPIQYGDSLSGSENTEETIVKIKPLVLKAQEAYLRSVTSQENIAERELHKTLTIANSAIQSAITIGKVKTSIKVPLLTLAQSVKKVLSEEYEYEVSTKTSGEQFEVDIFWGKAISK